MSDSTWINKPFSVMGHVFDHWLLPKSPSEVVAFKKDLAFDSEHWLGSLFKTGGCDGKSWLFANRFGWVKTRATREQAPTASAASPTSSRRIFRPPMLAA